MVLIATLSSIIGQVDSHFAAILDYTNSLYCAYFSTYSSLSKNQDIEGIKALLQPKSTFRLSFLGYYNLKDDLSPEDQALVTLIQST